MRTLGSSFVSVLALVATASVGCDRVVDPEAPTDGEPPVVRVTAPSRGEILGDVEQIVVTGTVTDPEADLDQVTVNGVRADVGADGAFTIAVPVRPGNNLVAVLATDHGRNETTDTRSVLAGAMSPTDMVIPDAVAAGISDDAFVAIGNAAAGYVASGDLAPALESFEPVVDYGWSGPGDCLYVRGTITEMTVGGAAIDLAPNTGGLSLDAGLADLDLHMHLEYAAACISGSRDITIKASQIDVAGDLDTAIAAGAFDIQLVDTAVNVDGLDIDLGGIPGAIVDLLQVDSLIEWLLPWAVERFVAPMVGDALGALGDSHTVSVLGKEIRFQMSPAELDFSPVGAEVRLDSTVQVVGDVGPGFVYVPNATPDLATTDGFRIALADDVANQLFAGFWGAGGMTYDLALSSGDYGDIGVLFDGVTIEARLPPTVRADGDGELAVVIGDLMASFTRGGDIVTQVAINGTVGLSVVPVGETGLRLAVGQPTITVDILDEGVEGANSLDHEQFEALVSFAATRATHIIEGPVGTIPLPSVGGVMLDDVEVAATAGFIRVDGRLR